MTLPLRKLVRYLCTAEHPRPSQVFGGGDFWIGLVVSEDMTAASCQHLSKANERIGGSL